MNEKWREERMNEKIQLARLSLGRASTSNNLLGGYHDVLRVSITVPAGTENANSCPCDDLI